jgi:hypothetical protein
VRAATWWGLGGNAMVLVLAPPLMASEAGFAYVRWLSGLLAG